MLLQKHSYNSMLNYFRGGNEKKNLVRFYYKDREDVFDLVSYQKGGRILNMLRNFAGEALSSNRLTCISEQENSTQLKPRICVLL